MHRLMWWLSINGAATTLTVDPKSISLSPYNILTADRDDTFIGITTESISKSLYNNYT